MDRITFNLLLYFKLLLFKHFQNLNFSFPQPSSDIVTKISNLHFLYPLTQPAEHPPTHIPNSIYPQKTDWTKYTLIIFHFTPRKFHVVLFVKEKSQCSPICHLFASLLNQHGLLVCVALFSLCSFILSQCLYPFSFSLFCMSVE